MHISCASQGIHRIYSFGFIYFHFFLYPLRATQTQSMWKVGVLWAEEPKRIPMPLRVHKCQRMTPNGWVLLGSRICSYVGFYVFYSTSSRGGPLFSSIFLIRTHESLLKASWPHCQLGFYLGRTKQQHGILCP